MGLILDETDLTDRRRIRTATTTRIPRFRLRAGHRHPLVYPGSGMDSHLRLHRPISVAVITTVMDMTVIMVETAVVVVSIEETTEGIAEETKVTKEDMRHRKTIMVANTTSRLLAVMAVIVDRTMTVAVIEAISLAAADIDDKVTRKRPRMEQLV